VLLFPLGKYAAKKLNPAEEMQPHVCLCKGEQGVCSQKSANAGKMQPDFCSMQEVCRAFAVTMHAIKPKIGYSGDVGAIPYGCPPNPKEPVLLATDPTKKGDRDELRDAKGKTNARRASPHLCE